MEYALRLEPEERIRVDFAWVLLHYLQRQQRVPKKQRIGFAGRPERAQEVGGVLLGVRRRPP